MVGRLGHVLSWVGCVLAILTIGIGVFFLSWDVRVIAAVVSTFVFIAFVVTVLFWLIGRAYRVLTSEPPVTAFISYSRKDALLVRQIIGLFAAVDVSVFRDEQSIKPGQKWRIGINAALEECQVVLVFWCEHAAASFEVRNEYERAIALSKRVVPVLLDQTALPPNLGQYQGVDLRAHHNFILSKLDDPNVSASRMGLGFPPSEVELHEIASVRHSIESASRQLQNALKAEFGAYIGAYIGNSKYRVPYMCL